MTQDRHLISIKNRNKQTIKYFPPYTKDVKFGTTLKNTFLVLSHLMYLRVAFKSFFKYNSKMHLY